jgi:hypothetical protein
MDLFRKMFRGSEVPVNQEKNKERKINEEQIRSQPVVGTYLDRLPFEEVEKAIRATNSKFGTQVGNGTINHYNQEQLTFFAQQLFPNKRLVRVSCKVEKGVNDGMPYFYLQGFDETAT